MVFLFSIPDITSLPSRPPCFKTSNIQKTGKEVLPFATRRSASSLDAEMARMPAVVTNACQKSGQPENLPFGWDTFKKRDSEKAKLTIKSLD